MGAGARFRHREREGKDGVARSRVSWSEWWRMARGAVEMARQLPLASGMPMVGSERLQVPREHERKCVARGWVTTWRRPTTPDYSVVSIYPCTTCSMADGDQEESDAEEEGGSISEDNEGLDSPGNPPSSRAGGAYGKRTIARTLQDGEGRDRMLNA